jgi:hypothetical protein
VARILVISCTTYGQNSRVKCHAEALVGHGDEVDVLCFENQRSVRSNGVNLIGLVRPRHRSMRGLCYVQFSISAAFNAVRFSLRRRYDVVVVYAMRTATILCAAPLRLLGSRITLDLCDEAAEAQQKEKAGRQGALRGRLLVMEEAIRARFANRVIVAHAIHRQLLRNLKIFGSGASNTTRILRSGIPACSEGSTDSRGWDHQQRQLLEAVDSLLEKETGARPASESSSGVGWRRVEWLRHGRQIGWLRSNPWRAEKPTLVFLRSTDIVPARPIVLELADAISSVHALAFPAYSACLPDLRLPDIVGKLRDTTLGWGHRLDVAGAVRQVFKRRWLQGNAMPMPGCRHCTIQLLSPIARFCTRCGSPLLGSRASVVKDDVVRRIVVLCKAGSQLVTSMQTRLRITTLNVAGWRRAVNAMAWLVKSPHPGGCVASIKTCARCGAKRINPQARFCTECGGCIAKETRDRPSIFWYLYIGILGACVLFALVRGPIKDGSK